MESREGVQMVMCISCWIKEFGLSQMAYILCICKVQCGEICVFRKNRWHS